MDDKIVRKSRFTRQCNTAYCDGRIIAANVQGIMLEIINTEQKKIERGKYYDKYIMEEESVGTTSDYDIRLIGCTKENIFCVVVKGFKENDKIVDKSFILVFDWELNPVKKFYVADNMEGDLFWFSNDCKSICRMNVNTEKQELFEGKIVF